MSKTVRATAITSFDCGIKNVCYLINLGEVKLTNITVFIFIKLSHFKVKGRFSFIF